MENTNAKILKEMREKINMTQKQLAELLHIDIRTVQNWETRGTSETTFAIVTTALNWYIDKTRYEKMLFEAK